MNWLTENGDIVIGVVVGLFVAVPIILALGGLP